MGALEDGRRICGDGTSEAIWRPWLGVVGARAFALDRWLPRGRRLVVVAPHPDDEILACGGLLALQAARGGDTSVIAVTDGEASHPEGSPAERVALAATRSDERERGLAELGVPRQAVTRLELPDGQVLRHAAQLRQALKDRLRQADLVVTTWRLDGHPDHEATGHAAASVSRELGCELVEAPVWMWHWSGPSDPRVPWQRLRELPLPAPVLARKARALAAHASQCHPRGLDAAPILGPSIRERAARTREYFFV
jgi:LmbE family N-acetylglucosaminyl deacetylase